MKKRMMTAHHGDHRAGTYCCRSNNSPHLAAPSRAYRLAVCHTPRATCVNLGMALNLPLALALLLALALPSLRGQRRTLPVMEGALSARDVLQVPPVQLLHPPADVALQLAAIPAPPPAAVPSGDKVSWRQAPLMMQMMSCQVCHLCPVLSAQIHATETSRCGGHT